MKLRILFAMLFFDFWFLLGGGWLCLYFGFEGWSAAWLVFLGGVVFSLLLCAGLLFFVNDLEISNIIGYALSNLFFVIPSALYVILMSSVLSIYFTLGVAGFSNIETFSWPSIVIGVVSFPIVVSFWHYAIKLRRSGK